jgi:hypothetical protein
MNRLLTLAFVLALGAGSATGAITCRDPKTGQAIKCPAGASSSAVASKAPALRTKTPSTPAPATTAKKPNCTKGVACGNSCIAVGKVCHKPA